MDAYKKGENWILDYKVENKNYIAFMLFTDQFATDVYISEPPL